MKINELLNESENSHLEEAPAGFFTRAAQKLGTYVPGGFGKRMTGAYNTSIVANKLADLYPTFLGSIGQKDPTLDNLKSFFQKEGFGGDIANTYIDQIKREKGLTGTEPITNKKINLDNLFLNVARLNAGGSVTPSSATSSAPAAPAASTASTASRTSAPISLVPLDSPSTTSTNSGGTPAQIRQQKLAAAAAEVQRQMAGGTSSTDINNLIVQLVNFIRTSSSTLTSAQKNALKNVINLI